MTDPATDTGAVFGEVYRMAMAMLARRADRLDLAAVAGWLAVYGGCVAKAARAMNRSEPWIRKRRKTLHAVLLPDSGNDEDDYLTAIG